MSCDHSFAQSCDYRCKPSTTQTAAPKPGSRYTRNCTTPGCSAFRCSVGKIPAPFTCLRCNQGLVGKSRAELEAIVATAQERLAQLPVEVCPVELTRLRERDQLLAEIEREVRPALTTHKDPAHAGRFLLDWLQRSNILRGQRI